MTALALSWTAFLGPAQHGLPTLAADAVVVGAGVAYLAAVRRLSKRGRRWAPARIASFSCGLLVLLVAVGSRLARLDDIDLTDHVIQHVLIMMVGPPLLVLGAPGLLTAHLAPRPLQVALLRARSSLPVRALAGPAGWALYYGAMWACFASPAFALSLHHPLFHGGEHVLLVALGCLFWSSVLKRTGRRGWPVVRRLAALVAGMPVEAALGAVLATAASPLPAMTLAGTHAGGEVFWMSAMAITGVALVGSLVDLAWREERRQQRLDARLDAAPRRPQPTG
ncbi:MAG: cytochrome c oxidase assembly protein [Acidimicrobiales bacterium]|nr:cytochrome c oxidase assembly protein [Acidimicrobiales bacterium]